MSEAGGLAQKETLSLVIITGLSGAGKSVALRCFEDMGYACIDNIPPTLMTTFVDLYNRSVSHLVGIALVTDIRCGELFDDFMKGLDGLRSAGYRWSLVFLTASRDVLINRFKETRRSHPLETTLSIEAAIDLERDRLREVEEAATNLIDTSETSPKELKEEILAIFFGKDALSQPTIKIIAFGFKYGIPLDADFIFDVRFLPNPYYEEEMKDLTGDDPRVAEYVMSSTEAREYVEKIAELVSYTYPHQVASGKSNITIALGCTGGKHRSVAIANLIKERLGKGTRNVFVIKRDVNRG